MNTKEQNLYHAQLQARYESHIKDRKNAKTAILVGLVCALLAFVFLFKVIFM